MKMSREERRNWVVVSCLAVAVAAVRSGPCPAREPASGLPAMVSKGQVVAALAPFDRLMMSFMRDTGVPGAALAVTRHGHLMLARGYGWADQLDHRQVEPTSLFRIASLSKPITAVAVLQLVGQGRLSLTSKPFTQLGLIDQLNVPGREIDPRLGQITVAQLLTHTGGFDRQASFDPMFRSRQIAAAMHQQPPPNPDTIVRYMMSRPLDFDPGKRYVYSNFGYCALGRLIEHVSSCSYEEYVRRNVFAPIGIRAARIGHTRRDQRAANEVTYYTRSRQRQVSAIDQEPRLVEPAYGAWCLESMDAHGGWLASAVDLARFASVWDTPLAQRLLTKEMIDAMFARPQGPAGFDAEGVPKAAYYACGWLVRPTADGRANQWHTGALPGTATLMVRRHDGLCWVVLFNARYAESGKSLTAQIDPLLHRAADAVETWPDHDLFAEYGFR